MVGINSLRYLMCHVFSVSILLSCHLFVQIGGELYGQGG